MRLLTTGQGEGEHRGRSRAAAPPPIRLLKTPAGDLLADQIPMFGADGLAAPVDAMYLAYGRSDSYQCCGTCFFFQRSRDSEGQPVLTCAKYPLPGIPEWFASFEACGLFERGGRR